MGRAGVGSAYYSDELMVFNTEARDQYRRPRRGAVVPIACADISKEQQQ
jgi:hypothetical protein